VTLTVMRWPPMRASAPSVRRFFLLAAILSVATACADNWVTAAYFELILGVPFTPTPPVVRCQSGTGFDYVAFRIVHLPGTIVDALRANPVGLASFPRQTLDEQDRKLRRWTQGTLSQEARDALELALLGAEAAVEESKCDGVLPRQVREWVATSVARDTSWHSYQFKQLPGEDRVLPEALDFRVLDPVAGVLYELVNFS
jgi:hypothetical protein